MYVGHASADIVNCVFAANSAGTAGGVYSPSHFNVIAQGSGVRDATGQASAPVFFVIGDQISSLPGWQEGAIASERGPSENNRSARFYRLTRAGRKRLALETRQWEQTTAVIDRFFALKAGDL